MIERNLEKRHLHAHHDQGLYQQALVESCAGPVEDPIAQHVHVSRMRRIRRTAKGGPAGSATEREVENEAHLNRDATSMIRGMSREKPALVLLRCIETAWSP